MSKYLKPCRGSYNSAVEQSLILKKGELFFEFPHGSTGKEPAKIMIGDGVSGYGMSGVNPNDTSGASTNSFAPALIHPVLYSPEFTDSNYATASWNINSGTAAISNIKPYSKDSHMGNLPKIIGNVKQALCNHADSIMKLYELSQNASSAIADLESKTVDLNKVYPKGSLYLAFDGGVNPNNFLPGTWKDLGATIGANYVLKTIASGDGASAAAVNTGATTLSINQIPKHTHTFTLTRITSTDGTNSTLPSDFDAVSGYEYVGDETGPAGSGSTSGSAQGHSHTPGMPASIGIHVWRRTN